MGGGGLWLVVVGVATCHMFGVMYLWLAQVVLISGWMCGAVWVLSVGAVALNILH